MWNYTVPFPCCPFVMSLACRFLFACIPMWISNASSLCWRLAFLAFFRYLPCLFDLFFSLFMECCLRFRLSSGSLTHSSLSVLKVLKRIYLDIPSAIPVGGGGGEGGICLFSPCPGTLCFRWSWKIPDLSSVPSLTLLGLPFPLCTRSWNCTYKNSGVVMRTTDR